MYTCAHTHKPPNTPVHTAVQVYTHTGPSHCAVSTMQQLPTCHRKNPLPLETCASSEKAAHHHAQVCCDKETETVCLHTGDGGWEWCVHTRTYEGSVLAKSFSNSNNRNSQSDTHLGLSMLCNHEQERRGSVCGTVQAV